MKQVLLNLLSNAVKFTPDGGRVEVSAKLDTDRVEIAVKDTGVGISPALTKRLVELHGGRILVDSAVGVGSTCHAARKARLGRQVDAHWLTA